uniref:Genome polyprotein n=1 Tax=Miniopterus picornavirus 1 TaxID=2184394 RepID=A0A2S1YF56_9VIRU|nr:polyprotein [Miniopterus picornavirus 1]
MFGPALSKHGLKKANLEETLLVVSKEYNGWSRFRTSCIIRVTGGVGRVIYLRQIITTEHAVPSWHHAPATTNVSHHRRRNVGLTQSIMANGNKKNRIEAQRDAYIINWYGTEYTKAYQKGELNMDPEKFTKPVTDIAAATMGPALKSPTVEEAGYSDRIMQLTSGNSTITTQEAAHAVVAYGKWPEYDNGVGEAIDAPTRPGPSGDRFYTLQTEQWTKNWTMAWWRFPHQLTNQGVFGQNCAYHFLMRSGYCFHVQCNASSFHQGSLLVVAIPECQVDNVLYTARQTIVTDEATRNIFLRQYPIAQLLLFPHQIINLRTNNSATIVWPYTNSTPSENALSHDQVTLVVIPLTPLDYMEGATPYVPITLSVAPMCSQFSGLRGPVLRSQPRPAAAQGIPVFEVPGSGQFVTTLRNEGYPIYPDFSPTPNHGIPGRVNNLLEICQVDTLCMAGENDTVLHLNLSQQTAPGGHIATWDLSLQSKFFSTTTLARLVKFYAHYLGSIKLTMMFCGSKMATGKILIAYTPPGGQAPTHRDVAMLGTHIVWDVGLQSAVSFPIPFISQSQYRFNNTAGSTMSYAGYISVYYQTNIVVPPGAPNTCPIIVMASACDDFVLRQPTDSAYYQGLGDDMGKLVSGHVKTAIESALNRPATTGSENGEHSLAITTGDAGALTAPETGATADANPGATMETRQVSTTYSGAATDVSNFMSKYGFVTRVTLRASAGGANGFKRVSLWVTDENTSLAIRTKYRMFTYFRCHYDIVMVTAPGSSYDANKSSPSGDAAVQYIFCAPGTPAPSGPDSPEWYLPTTPSVISRASGTPSSLRVPFLSVCSAYASRFDGYPTFDPMAEGDYGKFPGNYLGDLFVRIMPSTGQTGQTQLNDSMIYGVYVYARPVNFEGYMPRPIVSLKASTFIAGSRHRYEFVNTVNGTTDDKNIRELVIGGNADGSDYEKPRKKKNTGPSCISYPKKRWDHAPGYVKKAACLPQAINMEKLFTFQVLPLHENLILLPLHLLTETLWFRQDPDSPPFETKYTVVRKDPQHDLALIQTDERFSPVKLCRKLAPPDRAWFTMRNSTAEYVRRVKRCHYEAVVDDIANYDDPSKAHEQSDMFGVDFSIPEGSCGSVLVCPDGVCGIASASDEDNGWFTALGHVPWLNAYKQGIYGWIHDICQDLGSAFGAGVSDEVKNEVQEAYLRVCKGSSVRMEMGKEMINWLIKAICATVMIARAEDKAATAATLGVMLGADLLLKSPFDWLQDKVNQVLGYAASAVAQGPVDWLKDFNVVCTSFKWLDWIAAQISKFVDWLKKLLAHEDPRRRKFMTMLEDLPMLMEHIDKIAVQRGKYDPELIKKVCNNMRALKRGADIYGIERHHATLQITKYYNKAMQILASMTKGRTEPVAMLIHGTPGAGKSLATEMIGRRLTEMIGGNRPYCLPPDPKHFDGYTQQPVVIMDDVGQNPDGEDLKLFCQMVSSTEFIPPMAALEEKGLAFTSDFVLASTNCQHLAPPTIVEPKALMRRFHLDLNIVIRPDYTIGNNKLDASKAFNTCNHKAENFRKCCPMVCGEAIAFVDRRTKEEHSMDDVVGLLMLEHMRRRATGDALEAFFQGSDDDDWLQSDYDKLPAVLKTLDEQVAEKLIPPKPLPKEIADLIMAVGYKEEIFDYCKKQGWVVPAAVEIVRTRATVKEVVSWFGTSLSILASTLSIAGLVYWMYTIFASKQGAYSGEPKKTLKKPELRRSAQVQGPDMQFATKLMETSLFDVKTDRGCFTGLGIYDNWMMLPGHAEPGEFLYLEDERFEVLDIVDLNNAQGNLELTLVQIDRPIKFRDIRKFFADHFTAEKDCHLIINNSKFRRMYCPVGKVSMFGFLNLSHQPVFNTCHYRYPTKSGQCGGVVVKAGKIIGMHIGGDGYNGYAAILTKAHVAKAQGQIIEKRKTTACSINVNSRTALHPSVFHDVFPGSKEPAALHPKDKRLEVDLDEAAFSKYKGNKKLESYDYPELLGPDYGYAGTEAKMDFPPETMEAIDQYVEQVRPLLPHNLTDPLDLEEVVYGIENLDGLDLSTSAGFPYVTKGVRKRDLIPERGQPLTKLQEALDLHGYDLPFVTYLKDELRPLDKIKKGKTRVIECSSLNDTIMMKRTFGRFFQTWHANPGTVTGSAVGCNPDYHWSQFYVQMGDQPLVAFDYSNFDASLHPCWFQALALFLQKLGYSKHDLRLIKQLCNSKHYYKDIYYTVEGGMPSGCSGTSVFNSIINNLIIKTLVLRCYKGIDLDQLKIIAYGDDVLVSYPWQLDAGVLAEEGANFGLTMTPPDKGDCFNEITWDNATFLKRGFRKDEQFPFLVHPVFPMSEIHESIRWTRSAAATQEHVASLCRLAWHNGRETYEDFVKAIRSVPVGRALSIPSFRTLEREWLELF